MLAALCRTLRSEGTSCLSILLLQTWSSCLRRPAHRVSYNLSMLASSSCSVQASPAMKAKRHKEAYNIVFHSQPKGTHRLVPLFSRAGKYLCVPHGDCGSFTRGYQNNRGAFGRLALMCWHGCLLMRPECNRLSDTFCRASDRAAQQSQHDT